MFILRPASIYSLLMLVCLADDSRHLNTPPPPDYHLQPLLVLDVNYNITGVSRRAGRSFEGTYSRRNLGSTVIDDVQVSMVQEKYVLLDTSTMEINTTVTMFYIDQQGVIRREERPDGTFCDLNDTALPLGYYVSAGQEGPYMSHYLCSDGSSYDMGWQLYAYASWDGPVALHLAYLRQKNGALHYMERQLFDFNANGEITGFYMHIFYPLVWDWEIYNDVP